MSPSRLCALANMAVTLDVADRSGASVALSIMIVAP